MTDEEKSLLLRSFDEKLDAGDRGRLDGLLERSVAARDEQVCLQRLRSLVTATRAEAFDAGFAGRVIDRLPRRRSWLDELASAFSPLRLAGGVAIAVVVALLVWLQPRSVSVPYGELRTMSFSDGSSAELSGGSTITYRRFFLRDERRVELIGEAYFDVAASERPFVVETERARVLVRGTRFNVRAWSEEETFVALAEGSVAVERIDGSGSTTLAMQRIEAPLVLAPGEAVAVGADSTWMSRSISLDRILSWRTGGIAFDDRPLGAVLRSLERRFDVRITADSAVRELRVSYLHPQPSSAAAVLSDICNTHDLHYRRTANGFEVLEAQP